MQLFLTPILDLSVVDLQSGSETFTITTKNTAFNNLIVLDTWQHLAFTFGVDGMKLYIDGVLVGENAYTGGMENNTQPIVIGGSKGKVFERIAKHGQGWFSPTTNLAAIPRG